LVDGIVEASAGHSPLVDPSGRPIRHNIVQGRELDTAELAVMGPSQECPESCHALRDRAVHANSGAFPLETRSPQVRHSATLCAGDCLTSVGSPTPARANIVAHLSWSELGSEGWVSATRSWLPRFSCAPSRVICRAIGWATRSMEKYHPWSDCDARWCHTTHASAGRG